MTGDGAVTLVVALEVRHELYEALWACVHEVAALYALERDFRVKCTALLPPRKGVKLRTLAADDRIQEASEIVEEGWWAWARSAGRSVATRRVPVPAHILGPSFQELLKIPGKLVIITDCELVPPPHWRYIIWDDFRGGYVVSTAPTSPSYWGETDPNEVAIIKRRVRAATVSAAGTALGLRRCDNGECFLYRDITDVLLLDDLAFIGTEHRRPSLAGFGFEDSDRGPQPDKQMTSPSRVRDDFYEGMFSESEGEF
jgi:hypothetical protein